MSKAKWITLISIVIVVISLGLGIMFILVPQSTSYLSGVSYNSISKSDYTYESTKYDPQTEIAVKRYETNSDMVNSGKKSYTYNPGNSNPLTRTEANIYYEHNDFYDFIVPDVVMSK